MRTTFKLLSLTLATFVMSPAVIGSALPTMSAAVATPLAHKLKVAQRSISMMSQKEKSALAADLGKSNRDVLEAIIPAEKKVEAASDPSCCWVFWRTYGSNSGKALGGLAIDIVRDLSDGSLDGKASSGESIDYQKHLIELVYNASEAYRTATAIKEKA